MIRLLRDALIEFLANGRCEETHGMIGEQYLRCGAEAVAIVKTRDPNPYPMCLAHATHNIDNRGAVLMFAPDLATEQRLTERSRRRIATA